jgi:hypothetical protein
MIARGVSYTGLPVTAEALLGSAPADASARATSEVLSRIEIPLDGPVEGGIAESLEIERVRGSRAGTGGR